MTDPRVFVICTGAGAGAQQEIWRVPGCSSYFEGAAFPYGQEQQDELFGFTPTNYVNEDAAIRFAMAAYQRAWRPGGKAVGVGLTAVAAGLKAHRGDHRIHLALMGDEGCWALTHTLPKHVGPGARQGDGALADALVEVVLRHYREGGMRHYRDAQPRALELLLERPLRTEQGTREPREAVQGFTLFPGAFNPPHQGHHGIRAAAGRARPFAFVISVDTPHKPHLTPQEMLQREKMLKGHHVLFLKGAPYYIDQAELFPESHFVMGSDALARMLEAGWYQGKQLGRNPVEAVLSRFSYLGTRFLVSARGGASIDDCFDKAKVDLKYRLMFDDIDFVSDLSSTALRLKT